MEKVGKSGFGQPGQFGVNGVYQNASNLAQGAFSHAAGSPRVASAAKDGRHLIDGMVARTDTGFDLTTRHFANQHHYIGIVHSIQFITKN